MNVKPRKEFASLVDCARYRAAHQQDQQVYTFLVDGETKETHLTFRELDQRARSVAARLQQTASPGARALLLFPPGLNYIVAFFGCLYSGIIAVPTYPPRLNRPSPRLQAILQDSQATAVLTNSAIYATVEKRSAHLPELNKLNWITTDNLDSSLSSDWQNVQLTSDSLAFLQYTSGSTALPKGVMVTHGNLISNQKMIKEAFCHNHESVVAGWLPLYHDMGLIGNVLQPLFLGSQAILMSPLAFLESPARWLQAISNYRAYTSGGPNFSFDLCTYRITPEQKETLDLSCWATAFNGAEPVRHETMKLFAKTFAPCGFRYEAFFPCYGLAEATLLVSGSIQDKPPVIQHVETDTLEKEGVAVEVKEVSIEARTQHIVGCGKPWLNQQIKIVDHTSFETCPSGQVGEIWVTGPNIAQGYWNRPEETEEVFHAFLHDEDEKIGPYLRTGDLGFIEDGELFVTGRLKDLIIIRGRNFYPQDIELTAERSHPALRLGSTAAFSMDVDNEERLFVVQEIKRRFLANIDTQEIVSAIRQQISDKHELQAYGVVLVKPGSIPKTSSGKRQRRACRARLLADELNVIGQDILAAANFAAERQPTSEALLSYKTLAVLPTPEKKERLIKYLLAVAAEALQVPLTRLKAEQPFNKLGVDSLTAVELRNRIENDLPVKVPLIAFLQGTTSQELAEQLLAQLETVATSPSSTAKERPVQSGAQNGRLYPSLGQERLWLLDQLTPLSPAYNIPVKIQLTGQLDLSALEASVTEVLRRHSVLRTSFKNVDGMPIPVIHPVEAIHFAPATFENWQHKQTPILDLQTNLKVDQTYTVVDLARQEAHRPFVLSEGPLIRVVLLRLAPLEHVLLLNIHHIVSDGWSMEIFIKEMAAFYQQQVATEEQEVRQIAPDLDIQYTDFAYWQRQQLGEEKRLQTQIDYWQQKLSGPLPVLEMPTDNPRPPVQTFRGRTQSLTLTKELSQRLHELSRGQGVTLFTTLLTVFKVLLSRYTNQTDLLLGVPIATRRRREFEELIGFFMNTLVLRSDLSNDPTFQDLLNQVHSVALEAYEHQDLPFEKLVEVLQPQRDLSRTPLFQILFNMIKFGDGPIQLPTLTLEASPIFETESKFDMTLYVLEGQEEIELSLLYNADLFACQRMVEMLAQYEFLLAQIVEDHKQRISHYSLLTEEAKVILPDPSEQIDLEWLGAVHERFAEQARQRPGATALISPQVQWTYGELNARSNQLAHYLIAQGIQPQDVIAIYSQRSASLVWALMSILKAGAAYVILDSDHPHSRLQEHLRRIKPDGWLQLDAAGESPQELQTFLDTLSCKCRLTLPECSRIPEWEALEKYPQTNPAIRVNPHDLLCIAPTSGSTGQPKHVLQCHVLSHFIPWIKKKFDLSHQERFSMLSALAHDQLQRDVFTALWLGATIVIPDPEQIGSPGWVIEWMKENKVTITNLTPAMGKLITADVNVTAESQDSAHQISSLRYAFFVGEVLTQLDIERISYIAPQVQVVNLFGTTETQRALSYYVVPTRDSNSTAVNGQHRRKTVPLGQGVPGSQLLILNKNRQQCGISEAGEIYIRSPYLALGYLNKEQASEARFTPNHFSQSSEDRLYRTGDLGRYLPEGSVEWIGRADNQVQIRAFRVELGEIEAVLSEHSAVRQSVLLAHENDQGEKRLAAYLLLRSSNGDQPTKGTASALSPSFTDLRNYLKERLPEYMIPSAFIVMDRFPLTPNGKIDRQAFPAPDWKRPDLEINFVPPATPIEHTVADIWRQALAIDTLGVQDNFFELGGHSLMATAIVSQIQQTFAIDLPLRTLFESPTVRELAQAIAHRRAEQNGDPLITQTSLQITPDPAGKQEPFPLTDVQYAYWLGRSNSFALGNVATHGYSEYDTRGLDLGRLEKAWQHLIERHDMLRAIVLSTGQQQISAEVPLYEIKTVDLREQPADIIESQLMAIREEMSHQILPADQWPLFEIRATYLDDERIRIHFSFDLLIGDAWSIRLLARELHQLYEDPSISLPALDVSFRDYVLADLALKNSPLYQRALTYWRERARILPAAPELPMVQDPESIVQPQFTRRQARLGAEEWQALKKRAIRSGLTPSVLLLTAYTEVLANWSASKHFTINLTLFSRYLQHAQINDVLGDFTSLTLLAVDWTETENFLNRARKVQQQLWDDMEHRYVSGVQVIRDISRIQGRAVARRVMPIVFTSKLGLNLATEELNFPHTLETVYSISQTPQVWLDHQVGEESGTLVFNWDAVEELFPDEMLDDMFAAYCQLLRDLASDTSLWHQPVLSLTPAAQLTQRQAVNATDAPIPSGLLHEPFINQVSRQPHKPAVVTNSCQLSYQELYEKANQVAHWLRENGAQPNELIGVVMEKGWEQIVAVIGILQAGAAYLPIDADLPWERVTYLLENSQATLALTQSKFGNAAVWPNNVQHCCVDDDTLATMDTGSLDTVQSVEDLAYVIFTSGSTGLPKGVMIDHRGALNTVTDVNRRFEAQPEDRVFGISALNFDLSVYDIFGVLGAGGTIVLPEAEEMRDPAKWLQLLHSEKVTIWNSVPALVKMLVEYAQANNKTLPADLRLVMMSGDWIPVDLPGQIRELLPDATLISMGGATEASIWSILYPIEEVTLDWVSIPYGKPMVNQSFHVLDAQFRPLPTWVPGDLYIGGIGLAKGYWRNREKTAASFVAHPRTGERLYRTGDLGRYLPDGNIEFLGRADFQVKIQGYRVELGEIESTLIQHPGVKTAVVKPLGERFDKKRLVGYFVSETPSPPSTSELRQFLQSKLPEYMVPAVFMPLETVPLTANGKVNRKALPVPDATRPDLETPMVLPSSQTEQLIAVIWREVLEIEQVGVHDNFFDLGGDSLMVMEIHQKLTAEFDQKLSMTDLFRYPTISVLAENIISADNTVDVTVEKAKVRTKRQRAALHRRARRGKATLNE